MPARFVHLQVQLRRIEDDGEPAARALRGGEQRHGLVGQRLGPIGEAEGADELVAGGVPAAARIGVRPALVLVAIDRVRLDRRTDVGDGLLGVAPVRRRECLPFALRRVHRLGERDALHPRRGLVCRQEVADLALERDLERILLHRRLVRAVGGGPVVEDRRDAQGGRARAGDAGRLGGHGIGFLEREDVTAREAPRPVDEDADTEALALAGRHAFDASGLDGDQFIEAADDAHIRVPRAQERGRIEGAIGQVSHAADSLAEGVRRRHCRCPDARAGRCARGSERRGAGDRLGREVEPEAEDEDRGRERDGLAHAAEGRSQ